MRILNSLPMVLWCATITLAQQPPVPVRAPVQPTPPSPPSVLRAPVPVQPARPIDDELGLDELKRRATSIAGQAWARAAEQAMESARVGMTTSGQWPVNVARAYEDARAVAGSTFDGLPFAATPRAAVGQTSAQNLLRQYDAFSPARWPNDGDQDPADSLYGVGRDALNRGDWRRAADLFSQVHDKYPRSTRIVAAAYYEAFSRYRIGTTDELRAGLRVLTDRGKGASQPNTQQEIASLTTRIHGALAARGDAESARILSLDAQKGGCDQEQVQVQSEALSALAQADMAAATPMLRRVLDKRDPCLLSLRRRALSIMLRRGDSAATSAAIAVARSTEETLELRTDAIAFLSRLPGDNALAALEDLLRNSTDKDVQRAAVRSLANSESSRARQAIRALIDRSDVGEQLRVEAINSMERDAGTGRAEDAAYLRALFPKLQAERLKMAAIGAISKAPGAENEQWVLGIARNRNESSDVRADAIKRMYRIKAITVDDIGKLYDVAESRVMREQIVSVLGQRTETETVDKLIELYKVGTDPRLQGQIVNALVKKNDPRARKLLADIVGK